MSGFTKRRRSMSQPWCVTSVPLAGCARPAADTPHASGPPVTSPSTVHDTRTQVDRRRAHDTRTRCWVVVRRRDTRRTTRGPETRARGESRGRAPQEKFSQANARAASRVDAVRADDSRVRARNGGFRARARETSTTTRGGKL